MQKSGPYFKPDLQSDHENFLVNGFLIFGEFAMLVRRLRWIIAPPNTKRNELVIRILNSSFVFIILNTRYRKWLKYHSPTKRQLIDMRKEAARFQYKPCMSIIMPVYNSKLKCLKAAIESVQSQVYPNWELCIADDASTNPDIKPYLEKMANADDRIKVIFRKKNGHISRASNSAIELASGEFIGMLDHDDVLYPHALFRMAKLLNKNQKYDLIYSDSDVIFSNMRGKPFFKPDWSPELFFYNNYLNHLTLMRKSLVDEIGGFRTGFEGSQDYDLYIRLIELLDYDNIAHISDVLYGWRAVPGSAASSLSNKDYAVEAGNKALTESLKRRNIDAIIRSGIKGNSFQTHYKIKNNPLVSIIINAIGQNDSLSNCLDTIYKNTSYQNREIIVLGGMRHGLRENDKIKNITSSASQNHSEIINSAAQQANGQFLLFLDEKVNAVTEHWLTFLLEQAQREEIGIIGPKIMTTNKRIFSAGMVFGMKEGIYGHAYHMVPDWKQHNSNTVKNYLALSGLCYMVEKHKFQKVGGYDKHFRIHFNHVDLCLKLINSGYRNVYIPYVSVFAQELHEDEFVNEEFKPFQDKWQKYIDHDPFYSPNFSRKKAHFGL